MLSLSTKHTLHIIKGIIIVLVISNYIASFIDHYFIICIPELFRKVLY
jgi:hypothetical protein